VHAVAESAPGDLAPHQSAVGIALRTGFDVLGGHSGGKILQRLEGRLRRLEVEDQRVHFERVAVGVLHFR
jgi:hypothetical protein